MVLCLLDAIASAAMARPSSSIFWRSLLHAQQNLLPPSSTSFGTFLHGFRFMSTGASPSPKLFVGGLSWATDENVLKQAFSSYGSITEARVVIDRETGRSRGFGYVSFISIKDAEIAKESMDGNNINGRIVRVDFAMEKPPSARSSGGIRRGGDGNSLGGRTGFGGETADSAYGELSSSSKARFPSQG